MGSRSRGFDLSSPSPRSSRGEGWGEGSHRAFISSTGIADGPLTPTLSPRSAGCVGWSLRRPRAPLTSPRIAGPPPSPPPPPRGAGRGRANLPPRRILDQPPVKPDHVGIALDG